MITQQKSPRGRLKRYMAHGVTMTAAIGFGARKLLIDGETVAFAVATGVVIAATGFGLTWCLTAPADKEWERVRYLLYTTTAIGTVLILTPEESAGIPTPAWAGGAAMAAVLATVEATWLRYRARNE